MDFREKNQAAEEPKLAKQWKYKHPHCVINEFVGNDIAFTLLNGNSGIRFPNPIHLTSVYCFYFVKWEFWDLIPEPNSLNFMRLAC